MKRGTANFKILFLGTGTSAGVPMVACGCAVCSSRDPRDRRLRSSIYLKVGGLCILVDTSPDFRAQALRHKIARIDHLLVTHAHVDHLFGLDDVRCINTAQKADIPLHAAPETLRDIRRIFGYIFKKAVPGTYRPKLNLVPIKGPFSLDAPLGGKIEITPVPVVHGWTSTVGFVFDYAGLRFAYVPDCHDLLPESLALLENLDLLALDTLKRGEHPTHLSLRRALDYIARIAPRRALLTHIGHDFSHEALCGELADAGLDSISPAYDGLAIDLAKEARR